MNSPREVAKTRREIEEVAAIVVDTEMELHVHPKQLLTYLRLMDLHLGLLINFGAPLLKDGLRRVVNRHTNFAISRFRVHQSFAEDSK